MCVTRKITFTFTSVGCIISLVVLVENRICPVEIIFALGLVIKTELL